MILPSEKLLSAVLNKIHIKIVEDSDKDDDVLEYELHAPQGYLVDRLTINIDTLQRLMKEWAYDIGKPLTIIWANNIVHVRIGEKRFYANEKDEYEGVRQACEYILEQQK